MAIRIIARKIASGNSRNLSFLSFLLDSGPIQLRSYESILGAVLRESEALR